MAYRTGRTKELRVEMDRVLAALGLAAHVPAFDAWLDSDALARALGDGERLLVRGFSADVAERDDGYGPLPVPAIWLRVDAGPEVARIADGASAPVLATLEAVVVRREVARCCESSRCTRERVAHSLCLSLRDGGAARTEVLVGELEAEDRALSVARALASRTGARLEVVGFETAALAAADADSAPSAREPAHVTAHELARWSLRREAGRYVVRDHATRGPREAYPVELALFLLLLAGALGALAAATLAFSAGMRERAFMAAVVGFVMAIASFATWRIARWSSKYRAQNAALAWIGCARVVPAPWLDREGAIALALEGRYGAALAAGEVSGLEARDEGGEHALTCVTEHGRYELGRLPSVRIAEAWRTALEALVRRVAHEEPQASVASRARDVAVVALALVLLPCLAACRADGGRYPDTGDSSALGPLPGVTSSASSSASASAGSAPSASAGSGPSASAGSAPSASAGSAPSASVGSDPSASAGSGPSASVGSAPSASAGSGPSASGSAGPPEGPTAALSASPSASAHTAAPPSKGPRLAFVEDDVPRGLERAKAEKKALFVEVWAPWCHTCLSMKAFVLSDPALVPLEARAVFAAIDSDRPENGTFVEKYRVGVWPTLFVLDATNGDVLGLWEGAASVDELRAFVTDAVDARDASAAPASPVASLVAAGRAQAAGRCAEATRHYRAALDKGGPSFPRRSEAQKGLIFCQMRERKYGDCVETGLAHIASIDGTSSPADFAGTMLSCAAALTAPTTPVLDNEDALAERYRALDATKKRAREAAAQRLRALTEAPPAGSSVDDRSDALSLYAAALESLGDRGGARAARERQLAVLEAAAAAAPEPLLAATFDYARMGGYLALGRGAEAVAMLTQRVSELPDSYEPRARLAQAHAALGRNREALTALDGALDRAYGPRRLRYLSLRAELLERLGESREERATLDRLIAAYGELPRSAKANPANKDGLAAAQARRRALGR